MHPKASITARLALRLLVLAILLFGVALFWLCPRGLGFSGDLDSYVESRRGRLVDVSEDREGKVVAHHRISYRRLRSSSGLEVSLALSRPRERNETPLPLVVMLGGFNTGRDAIDLIGDPGPAYVAALSYPYEGERRIKGAMAWAKALRGVRLAAHDTPAALMLSLDYLLEQPGVDSGRVELVGVSLGGFFAAVSGALDERFSRVWCVHSGAGYPELLEGALKTKVPNAFLRPLVGFGDLLVRRLDPEDYVARIAPRELVLINAKGDERIPQAAAERLFAAAVEPKRQIWLPTSHIDPSREKVIQDLAQRVLGEITGVDDFSSQSEEAEISPMQRL